MSLTSEQIEHIERIKKELGIDSGLGGSMSERTAARGHHSGIATVTPGEGRQIATKTFNQVIIKVLADLDKG